MLSTASIAGFQIRETIIAYGTRKTQKPKSQRQARAVFDSFLNNLTSYALAAQPSKAIGTAHMSVSILLGKTRAAVIS
jgi:hypothetical protein